MQTGMKIDNGSAILTINPKLYPLEIIYSASYVFLDEAYIMLDGDPKIEIIVRIKPKKNEAPEKLGNDFFNELINYGDYRNRAKETKRMREMLLERALIGTDPHIIQKNNEFIKEIEESEEDFINDPEQIVVPWEERYGKDKNKDE